MQEKIRELKTKIDEAVQKTETGRALYELKLKFQAELKDIMSGMRELPKEERPTFGKVVNEFKQSMEENRGPRRGREEKGAGKEIRGGAYRHHHAREKIFGRHSAPRHAGEKSAIDVFAGMGFKIFEGPEI